MSINEMKRGKAEQYFDRHNHKMEFLRTIFGAISAIGGLIATLRVMGII